MIEQTSYVKQNTFLVVGIFCLVSVTLLGGKSLEFENLLSKFMYLKVYIITEYLLLTLQLVYYIVGFGLYKYVTVDNCEQHKEYYMYFNMICYLNS